MLVRTAILVLFFHSLIDSLSSSTIDARRCESNENGAKFCLHSTILLVCLSLKEDSEKYSYSAIAPIKFVLKFDPMLCKRQQNQTNIHRTTNRLSRRQNVTNRNACRNADRPSMATNTAIKQQIKQHNTTRRNGSIKIVFEQFGFVFYTDVAAKPNRTCNEYHKRTAESSNDSKQQRRRRRLVSWQ